MPKILANGAIVSEPPQVKTAPKTDGKRRLSDWLGAFLDYTHQAESPINYLRWVGLSTIAGAAQRKIFMESTLFFAHTNMYVVLVGPPGSKKSTAIRQGRKLLKQIPTLNLSSDAPSIVGLMDDFKDIQSVQKDHQSLNAFISELSTLFENAPETITGFLTAIYDGDDDYIKRTRIGGKEHIPFPWLNFIAGTTPSWLGDNLTRSAVEGGLVARTIYVHSDEIVLKSPFPRKDKGLRDLEQHLVHDLAHISQLYGEFDFAGGKGGDAERWYDKWYMDRSRLPRVSDNRTAGYYVRKPVHLLKVAMALALSRKDTLELAIEDLELAKAFLGAVEPGMRQAFSSVGGNAYATDLERIFAQITASGLEGMTMGEITSHNYHALEKRMIEATIGSLVVMGKIKQARHETRGTIFLAN